MKYLVIDIETKNIFDGYKKNPQDLDVSVVGTYYSKDNKYRAFVEEEFDELWDLFRDVDVVVGFNSNHFDIPILNKYSPIDLKKEIRSIDLLDDVKKSLHRRIKLDWIAKGTLNKEKSGDGLDAVKWWSEGEVEKVKEYCLLDVKITKDIFEYVLRNKKLYYDNLGVKRELVIDTTEWEGDEFKKVISLF